MRIAVTVNMTSLRDADVCRFVRAAIRGHSDLFPGAFTIAVYDSERCSAVRVGERVTLKIPPLTDLEKLANLTKVRPVLPRRITDTLFNQLRTALLPPRLLRDQRVAPDLCGRRNKTTQNKPTSKIEAAQADVVEAEERVKKYERLMKRAQRLVTKRKAKVRRLERLQEKTA